MKLVTFLGSHGRDRLGAIIGPPGDEHVLDLATGETVDWIYTDGWLSTVLDGGDPYA